MGADGHIVICTRAAWDEANLGVGPEQIGLYVGDFLSQPCCWGYYGDNLDGGNYYDGSDWCDKFHLLRGYRDGQFYDRDEAEQQAVRSAAQWFENHAETHEVWT